MTQPEFRIDVGQGTVSYKYGYAGDEPEEQKEDVKLPLDNLTLQTAKLLEGWLKVWDRIGLANSGVRKILLKSDTFKIIGKHLWMLILDNDVGAKLQEKIQTLSDPPLRVVINFEHASSDIRGLPWEFLCTPDTEIFLAAETKLLLTRLAPQYAFPRNQVEHATDRLGVLFVTALPRMRMYKHVNDRVRNLLRELKVQPGLAVLNLIEELDVDGIKAALSDEERPCHVVHITGLCRGEPGQPQLWMEADNGGPDWRNPKPLVDALTPVDGKAPRLVVLQLCETEEGDADENFERLAPELIRRGIPAVLAMQYPLPSEDKSRLWTKFYKDLATGVTVGEAVQTGRHGLLYGRDLNREFGTPVLYLHEDGALVQQGAKARSAAGANPLAATAGATVIRRALQRRLAQVANHYSEESLHSTRQWLASVPLTGTMPDARQHIRARLRAFGSDEEILELCEDLAASLKELEGQWHEAA
jgi:hypothetical protein